MKKSFLTLLCAGLFAGSAILASAQDAKSNAAPAAPSLPASTAKTNAPAAARHIPFVGIVASIDKTNQSLTLEGPKKQVVYITAKTKISKQKQPATFDGITVGARVSGSRVETKPGHWDATTLSISVAEKKAQP